MGWPAIHAAYASCAALSKLPSTRCGTGTAGTMPPASDLISAPAASTGQARRRSSERRSLLMRRSRPERRSCDTHMSWTRRSSLRRRSPPTRRPAMKRRFTGASSTTLLLLCPDGWEGIGRTSQGPPDCRPAKLPLGGTASQESRRSDLFRRPLDWWQRCPRGLKTVHHACAFTQWIPNTLPHDVLVQSRSVLLFLCCHRNPTFFSAQHPATR